MQALCNNVYSLGKQIVTSGWGATTYCQRGVLQRFGLLESQGSLVRARLVRGTRVSMQLLSVHEPTKMISQPVVPYASLFTTLHVLSIKAL